MTREFVMTVVGFFAEVDSGLVGAPYCIAFDWVGRNMYIGNIIASEISLVTVDRKTKYRMLVLDSRGDEKGVAEPISLAVHPQSGALFWLDRGGRGVPTKIGKVNMDGTDAQVLIKDDLEMPDFMTIDIQKEIIYFSSSHNPKIESCNLDGTNRRTILAQATNHHIAKVTGIAVRNRRLYYLDPKYEKVAQVDASDGSNEQLLIDNEADLRTLKIFQKRQRSLEHPCLTNHGGCTQICIPHGRNKRKCGCSVGYQVGDSEIDCKPYDSYAVISQLKMARGFDVNENAEAMVPISGPGHNILHMDFVYESDDSSSQNNVWIYWVDFESDEGGHNGIYRVRPDGSDLTHVISEGIGKSGLRGIGK